MEVRQDEPDQTRANTQQLNRLYSVLSKISEAIVNFREEQALFDAICRITVEDGGFKMAWVGIVDDDQTVQPVTSCGVTDGYLERVRTSALEIPDGLCPAGTAIREDRHDVCDDLEADERQLPWRLEAIRRGFMSHAAFPLREESEVIGVLCLYAGEPHAFDSEQVRLLTSLAETVSFAIESIEREDRWRKAEETLRLSEKHYRSIIENNLDIIMIVDEEGTVRYINPSVQKVLGYRRSEVRGKNIRGFVHPEDASGLLGACARALEQPDRGQDAVARVRDSSGSWRFMEFVGKGLYEHPEEVVVVLNARDITERRMAEEARKKDRDFISEVLDTTGALVVVLDGRGHVILFNRTCENTTGYAFAEVRGRHFWDVFSMPDETGSTKAFFEASGSGVREEYESHCLTRDGGRRLVAWSNSVIFGPGGAVEYVICTGIDMTGRREAEAALRESEERYRSIFDYTGTAMCLAESDTTISFVNHEFERLTGYAADETETAMRFVELLSPEDTDDFLDCFRELQLDERHGPACLECRVVDREGQVLEVFAHLGPLPGLDRCIISLIDLSKEKRYESALSEKAERLRDFLTVASHELRHPITVVKGYAKTLTEYMDTMPSETVKQLLGDIDSAADRLTHYVEELMDVSRVEEGRFPVHILPNDPETVVNRALEDIRVMGVTNAVEFKVAEGTGLIDVDHEKFTQLLVLLLDNAVKFSPLDTPVEIEVIRENGEARVSVLDRGMGVPEDDRENIFDRFYQVEEVQHHSSPGMGLGLYVAREIVKAHDGRIWCEPRDGGGSAFCVAIP